MAGQHPSKKPLGTQPKFTNLLGLFHGTFATVDLTVDWAIGKFLNIAPQETHILTGGLMFGPKARLLTDLVARSDNPKKSEILKPLNRIRGTSMRDIITHGYLWSDDNSVKFIHRKTSNEYKCVAHPFTFDDFADHVLKFVGDATDLYTALDINYDDINAFASAALSVSSKPKTSPVSPASKGS